jgi:hypothetical protein
MTLTLRIPRASPSLNDFANPYSSSKYKYRELRKRWNREIGDALLEARVAERKPLRWPRPPKERVYLVVTRYAPEHQWLDADNLAGGMKPVLDALKAHDVIADDNTRAIELTTRQDVSPHAQPTRWTEIELSIDPPMRREWREDVPTLTPDQQDAQDETDAYKARGQR